MNFIFFNPDEMRASASGCYGNSVAQTPNIDRLAREGTRFANTSCQSTVCSPSRCSFLTGWYPHVRGHRTLTHLLQPDEPNLLRTLKEHGYDVLYIGKNDTFATDVVEQACRLPGFDIPSGIEPVWNHPPFRDGDHEHLAFLFEPIGESVDNAMDTWKTRAAIRFLDSRPQEPFALFLALEAPHPPYCAPQPYHDMIDPATLPDLIPPGLEGKPTVHERLRTDRNLDRLPAETLRKIQAVYLGQTAYSDYLLGQVLDALERNELTDDTAVVFFSDHGDYAGDYGLVEKWPTGMEDVITQVPFIIRAPGGTAGHVVEEPTELFDLMPTVLELAGIESEAPHFAQAQTKQILGGAGGDSDRIAYCEGGYAGHDWHGAEILTDKPEGYRRGTVYHPKYVTGTEHPQGLARTIMARSSTHKLIYRISGENEFYNLVEDPRETRNLWNAEHPCSVQQRMMNELLHWLASTSDVIPFKEDPRDFPVRQPRYV